MNRSHFLYFFQSTVGLPTTIIRKIACYGDLQFLWEEGTVADFQALGLSTSKAQQLCISRSRFDCAKALNLLDQHQIQLIQATSSYYPNQLKHIHSPPALLYAQGNLTILQNPHKIAIVGTRNLTSYGQRTTGNLINKLAGTNVTIVSGGAWGIDTLALKSALDQGMPVIAIIGSGLIYPTPAANHQLYRQIRQSGLILSEYPPQTQATKYTFPERNRIISGISQATIVVEAPQKSGALITARFALEQGNDVYAIPGPIDAFASAGTNALIANSEAGAINDLNLLPSILGLGPSQPQLIPNIDIDTKQLFTLLQKAPQPIGQITKQLNLTLPKTLALLSKMELQGLVGRDVNLCYFCSGWGLNALQFCSKFCN